MPDDFDNFALSLMGIPPKAAEAPATPEAPAAPITPPATPEVSAKPTPAPIPLKPMSGKFGEGENLYDSDSAIQAGIQADKETGHYQSRIAAGPNEGLILKHETHPTFAKTIEGEQQVGNTMYRSPEGRLYSFEASKAAPEGYTPYVPPAPAAPQVPPPLGIPAPKQAADVYDRMAKQPLIPEAPIPQVPETDFDRIAKGGIIKEPSAGTGEVDVASLSPEAQKYLKDNAPGDGGILSSLARGAMRGVAGTVGLTGLVGEGVAALGGPKELADVLQFAGKEGSAAINKLADYAFPRSAAAANMPRIDLDQFLDDPGKVLTQMNDHLGNPEFWKTNVPEGLGSMLPLLVGGWFKAMRAAPVIKGLMAAGETVAAQALAKQTAKSVGRLAYFTTAGMEGGNFYEDLKKFEKETGQQVPIHIKVVGTLGVGAINGALELVGLQQVGAGKALRTMLGSKPAMDALEKVITPTLLTNVRKAFLGEGGQETAQQLVSNAFTQAGYNPSHKLTEGVAESALAGGFGGIAMGVPAHIYNTPAAAKKAGVDQNIDMTQPPVVTPAGAPVQQGLPGMEGEVPVTPVTKPPPLGTPTGVIETPTPAPVETPAPAPVETPVETPPPTDLGTILAGAGNIEEMSFDDLVKHVQDRLQQAQAVPVQTTEAEVPKAAETILGQPLADSSTLGKEVAAQPRPESAVRQAPLGTPASMMAMVTSPEETVGEYEPGPLFGEKGKAPDMQRFLFENGLAWDEVQAWDTTKLSDLQYEYEAWQQEVQAAEPALPTGPAWEAFLDDNDPDKYLGPEPGRYKPEFEEKWWPTLGLDAKNGILDLFREFAAENGMELPADLAAPAPVVAQEVAPQLAPEMLEQLKAAHQAAIEKALNEGRMTIEQATELGHLGTHATLSWNPPAAPGPTITPVERPQSMGMSWDDFAAESIPKLQQTIQASHAALFDTEALATSQFYDGSFPIPREGGILMARQSELYRTDPAYRDNVEVVIQNIAASMVDAHKKMNLLRGVYTGGGFGIMYEGEGMTSTGVSAGYALSPDGLSLAWYLMGADKYSAYYKGDVSVREALQNSLDAVLSSIKKGSIEQGEINIEVQSGYRFSVEDNGIGMDAETIRDKFLGLFGSTKRGDTGRFGKFGIAKAIILKPTKEATWTIETRDFYFDNRGAENQSEIMRVAPGDERQGTKISVDCQQYAISDDALKFVETTEPPANITVNWNGMKVKSPFEFLQGKNYKVIKVDKETSLRVTYYKDAPSGYDNKLILRLSDKKTGAKLTQNIKQAASTWSGREGMKGCLVVDVETKATVGKPESKYPFKDSRDELKEFASKHVEKIIEELTAKPPPPPRPKRVNTTLGQRGEFRRALAKIESDPDYQELTAYIDSLGLKRTPLAEFPLAIEAGTKGRIGGNVASIKQLVAYEAVVQLTAKAIAQDMPSLANIMSLYDNPYMVYGVVGNEMKAEFDSKNSAVGFNYMFTTPAMLADPHRMAHHLRDRANHELGHYLTPVKPDEDIDDHGKAYNATLSQILDLAAPAFDTVLAVAEKALGKVATDIRTMVGTYRNFAPAGVDPKSLSITDLLSMLKAQGYADLENSISRAQLNLWKETEEVNYANVELFQPTRELGEAKQANLFNAELEGDLGRAGGPRETERVRGEPKYAVGAGDVTGGEGRLLPGGGPAKGGTARTALLGIPAGRGGPRLAEPGARGAGPASSRAITVYDTASIDPAELPWSGEMSVGRDYLSLVSEGGKLSKTVVVDISALEVTEKTSKEQVEQLKEHIRNPDNDLPPLVVERDTDGLFVVDGHNRLQAAKELGYTKIPVREYITPPEAVQSIWSKEAAKSEDAVAYTPDYKIETELDNLLAPFTDLPQAQGDLSLRASLEKYLHLVRQEYGEKRLINFVGRKLNTEFMPYELALIGQTLRSPAQENLQLVFTKDGEIVGHNAVTSGHLGTVDINDFQAMMQWTHGRLQDTGADKVHVIHNHPSGVVKMSDADVMFEKSMREGYVTEDAEIKGLGDAIGEFIVINHGTFSYVTRAEGRAGVQVTQFQGNITPTNQQSNWMFSRAYLPGVKEIAEFGARLPVGENDIVLIFTDSNHRVNGVVAYDVSLLEGDFAETINAIEAQAKLHNADSTALLADFNSEAFLNFLERSNEFIGRGEFTFDGTFSDVQDLGTGISLRADNLGNYLWKLPAPEAAGEARRLMESPAAPLTTDRQFLDAYEEEHIAPAPRATTWKEALSNFKDIATIKANVIPALWKFWQKTYTEIFAEHAPIERLAQAAKKFTLGFPRKVGELLDWVLAAHRGSQGFANHALVGGPESGVFLPKMDSGYDTTETEAIMAQIKEAETQSGGAITSKVRRLYEKLADKMAERYTTGDIEKVHDSLAVTVEPLRALAERRGTDVDQVFKDLFNKKMVAERNLELRGEIGDRLNLIEKGTDVVTARAVLEALQREYGDDYKVLEDVSKGVRSWADAAIIEPLVRSGRLSSEIATQIRQSNQFYIPFFRLMEEMNEKGFVGSGESIFEVRKIPVKEIKGSERKIIDTLSMLHSLCYNVADVAGRAQVAQTIAQIPLFSGAGGDIKVVRAKFFPVPVELKQETDPVLRSGLQKIADLLEVDVKVMQRVKSFRGALGVFIRAMQDEEKNGVITPVERTWIELMFGTTERTKAHEVGHAIDHKYSSVVGGKRVGGLIQALMRTPEMKKELRAIADQRASDSASPSFRKYIRQREEQVADFVNRYINSNDQANRLAPNVTKAFEAFIRVHPELTDLLTLRPSGQAEVMTIEGQTWTKSPFRPEKNSLMIFRNGKPSWVTMPEDVFKACMGMTRGDVGVLVKIAAKPASWLRAGAVLSPEFISRNPLRDVVMAWVFSRHGFGFTGWFSDIYKLFTGDEEAKALLAKFHAGGAGFADLATMFIQTQALDVDKIMGKKKGIKYLAHPIEALREISSFMENATRFSVYRQSLDAGAGHAAAIHEARTVTLDFHRFGGNPYVRALNMIIPFFNASLQGVDKLGSELLGGDKARAMQVARKILLGITLPSILLWAAFGDDDRIKKLEAWERNLFWHIPLPGGPILRFPKPFEVGIMFGSIPERLLDYAKNDDSTGLKKALAQAFDSLTPSPWPTIVRPFMEQYSNWNFFMGRPIEDAAMKNLPVELRSKPWTSEAAKFFSGHFGKYLGISPVMAEQHIRNMFGGLGSNYALPMIDFSMRKAGMAPDIPKADEKWYLQTPFIRSLFSREPTGFRSKQAADFFENYQAAFTTDQGWKSLWKNGQAEDAAQMIKEHPEAIFARMVRKEMTVLGKLRKERDTITRDMKLDGAQKREKLDALDKRVDAVMLVNTSMMHPKVMEQITAPVTTAIKKTAKTDKDVEKYYNLANQPIAKAYEQITKDWKKYEAMGDAERTEAIIRLIKEKQSHPMPSGAGGKKKESYSVLGLPEKSKKGVDIFGEKGKSSGKRFELFPTK